MRDVGLLPQSGDLSKSAKESVLRIKSAVGRISDGFAIDVLVFLLIWP